jgi:hypothetical protein
MTQVAYENKLLLLDNKRGIVYINGKLFMSASRGPAVREFVRVCNSSDIYQKFHLYFIENSTTTKKEEQVKD